MARRKSKRNRQVLVIDPQTIILTKTDVQDAVEKILKGKAFATENTADEFFYGPPDEIGARYAVPVPVSICLKYSVHKPEKAFDEVFAARRQILDRDNWTCAYCGQFGSTIDHIHPQSQGGENTWLNLVAACEECNQMKDDMSLSEFEREFGGKLLWQPYVPDPNKFSKEQLEVWEKIADGVIDIPDDLE